VDANEYAFALGALSHYTSDIVGHPAVNQAVSLRYPMLRAKYGSSVRYAQGTTAHLKTEFGFDTLQVAKNRYASEQYHEFIGFKVAQPLLERTFLIVYGLPLKDVLTHEDLAIGSYRYSVSRLILTGPARVSRQYANIGGYSEATHASAVSYSSMFGETIVKIDYQDYHIQLRPSL